MNDPPTIRSRALCKYRGMLVIGEMRAVPRHDGVARCPFCGAHTEGQLRDGWLECDEFGDAVLHADWQRIAAELG